MEKDAEAPKAFARSDLRRIVRDKLCQVRHYLTVPEALKICRVNDHLAGAGSTSEDDAIKFHHPCIDPDSQAILDFIAKSERGILLKS